MPFHLQLVVGGIIVRRVTGNPSSDQFPSLNKLYSRNQEGSFIYDPSHVEWGSVGFPSSPDPFHSLWVVLMVSTFVIVFVVPREWGNWKSNDDDDGRSLGHEARTIKMSIKRKSWAFQFQVQQQQPFAHHPQQWQTHRNGPSPCPLPQHAIIIICVARIIL